MSQAGRVSDTYGERDRGVQRLASSRARETQVKSSIEDDEPTMKMAQCLALTRLWPAGLSGPTWNERDDDAAVPFVRRV